MAGRRGAGPGTAAGESGVEDGGEREEQRFIHDTAAWKMGGGNGDLMSGALAAAFR